MTKENRGIMADVDIRQIVELVQALDRSRFDSLQLDFGNFRLTLGKGLLGVDEQQSVAPQPLSANALPPAARAAASTAEASAAAQPAAPPPQAARAGAPGTVEVRSPIMGLFYAKPDPSSPPFVSVGTQVDEGTTVGLIEVMKVFNAVQAGANGVIAEICVENGHMVEIGQTLFRIRPKAEDG
jgi:acetyl-CoA carboxylase biotin carboxyl carrier protein